ALEAAGIAADLPAAVDRGAPAYREAFAYALRDGVTAGLRRAGGATRGGGPPGGAWAEGRGHGTAGGARSDGCRGGRGVGGRGGGYRWSDRHRALRRRGFPVEGGGAVVIRVLLADDQALVRGALAAMLSIESDIEVVAEVGSGDEVVPAAQRTSPDVALLDV